MSVQQPNLQVVLEPERRFEILRMNRRVPAQKSLAPITSTPW